MPAPSTNLKALIAATVVCSAVPAHASFMLAFNRDRTPMSDFTSLTVTQDDLTATLSRGGETFTFSNMYHNDGAESFGARSLTASDTSETPFVVDFSRPVTNFSVSVAHLDGDNASAWLEGFSETGGSGAKLGEDAQVVPSSNGFSIVELHALAGGIQSVRFGAHGGDSAPIYFDNLTVLDIPAPGNGGGSEAVPLPSAAYAAIGAGAMAYIAQRRARRTRLA
jgi:hypothetical protein